jgi:hypothetical protein
MLISFLAGKMSIFYSTFGENLESSQPSGFRETTGLFSKVAREQRQNINSVYCLRGMLLRPWKQLLQQATETET